MIRGLARAGGDETSGARVLVVLARGVIDGIARLGQAFPALELRWEIVINENEVHELVTAQTGEWGCT